MPQRLPHGGGGIVVGFSFMIIFSDPLGIGKRSEFHARPLATGTKPELDYSQASETL